MERDEFTLIYLQQSISIKMLCIQVKLTNQLDKFLCCEIIKRNLFYCPYLYNWTVQINGFHMI